MGDQLLPLPLTERTVHLCVDMQRIFSAEGPWPTPWMDKVLPVATTLARRHPERTIFTRFIPPLRPDQTQACGSGTIGAGVLRPRAPRSPAAGLDAALGRPLSSFANKRSAEELLRSNRHVVVDVLDRTNRSASSQTAEGRLCPEKRPRSVNPPASHSELLRRVRPEWAYSHSEQAE
jgi:hypothetical protein